LPTALIMVLTCTLGASLLAGSTTGALQFLAMDGGTWLRLKASAAEGSAKNFDFGFFGGGFVRGLGAAGAGGYSNTPQGKIVVAAFADSYNQMVKALRNYKAQTVKGGLGTGGRLGVQGGKTDAAKEIADPKKK